MSDLENKLVSKFIKFGCTRRNAAATYQVYLELCEVRRLFDVNYYFNDILKRMYLTAKNFNSSELTTYLPICASENLSLTDIQKIFNCSNRNEIVLAITTTDSNCCFYQLSNGLPVFNSTNRAHSMMKMREHHDVQLNLKKSELETNLNIRILPALTEDDGSRTIVGPMSRQWYPNW